MSVHSKHSRTCLIAVAVLALTAVLTGAQEGYDDHQHMMDQLGLQQLRPGANPNNQDTFDEATANRYADTMPDVLTMKDGTKVTSAAQWPQRRAEIFEDFEREVYGRVPPNVPNVTWEVTDTTRSLSGDTPIVTKTLVGHVDNSACPSITVDIQASFTVPAEATGPVPIMIEFDFGWPGRRPGLRPWQQLAIARGWGYGSITPNSIQPDRGGMNLRQGIIGLTNQGAPRKPDQWGALRAWGWGVSRLIDYFEANPGAKVDPKKVGIEGVSRYGKAALVAAAFDERVAVTFVASSGEGGAKLHRHIFGEAVENLTSRGEYHWMAGNFIKYGASDPCMTAADLPVDSHELIGLCAPRPCFISYGVLPGDPPWVDAHGSFMAGVLAGPAYELLGKRGLGTAGNYLTDPMPPVGTLIGGELAWRQHEGGHTSGPNWPTFFEWIGRYITAPPLPPSRAAVTIRPVARTDRNSQIAHAQLLEKAQQGRIDVYFEGDSIMRRWGALDYPELLANWRENFFGWNAADFAWGGDTVQNILWRLENGELDGVHPKVFVLQAGTNNIGKQPSRSDDDPRIAEVTAGIEAILDIFRAKAPEATIILIGIFPRNDNAGNPTGVIPVIDRINANLADLADGKKIRYLNINDKLADRTGRLYAGMTADKLHLSRQGCQVWADALKPVLTELLGPPAREDHAPPPTGNPAAANRSARTDAVRAETAPRERISLNADWRFMKYPSREEADELIYDVRPEVRDARDNRVADAKPTEAVDVAAELSVLKPWILPTGNSLLKDPAKRHARPEGNPGSDFPYVQGNFNDRSWQRVDLPHDWAIEGPFHVGWGKGVSGGMGRLPSPGVAWYRRQLDIPASDAGKSIFLDVDGAMSYAMVWLNGQLVGGWPYGYASWRVDMTPYVVPGGENQLAIRLDNPPNSSRWYPGGGIYRNVWLTKTRPVHVSQWGTFVTTRDVSPASATIDLEVTIDNDSQTDATVGAITHVFALDADGNKTGAAVAGFEPLKTPVAAGRSAKLEGSVTLKNPRLWGPPPTQIPHRYTAVTTLWHQGRRLDQYETRFGIRSLRFDSDTGIYVNGEHIKIKGVNQHHDLGALGAAFNTRAAERQLEILREMGCNAIRTAHNPPAPELLELTDRMGFLVVDEIFDVWERKKTPLDFHLVFPDWHEQDARAFVRRDRNHPSVILWSFGNEVGEQYTGEQGAALAKRLHTIVKQEDPTRLTTSAMNWAKPHMPFPASMDVISLNYQGEGIRQSPEFEGTNRIRTKPQYPVFHEKFPDKVIFSSETASAFSSRNVYLFPVVPKSSDIVRDGRGGDSKLRHVSAYELHAVDFGSSADKVFASLDKHPFVAGEFVWTGWDHLGEPTPYYESRSSYCGIIDLAGFKKDRFYLYQSHWRPDLPMAHILPHWTWPQRVGEITPVHVFTSGDEAELFLNGKSLGRKKKGRYEYRLRWDEVKYEPGELKVVAYQGGKQWATDVMRTAGLPARLLAQADRSTIAADGKDLSFVTVTVVDKDGILIPRAKNRVRFSIDGPGEIVATDNGDPTSFESFQSGERNAFNGLCLVIVRAKPGQTGAIALRAESEGLKEAAVTLGCEAAR